MTVALVSNHRVSSHIIHAVIGVWYRGDETFYVKRSAKMENYPGAWSLFSIQYDPAEMPDSLDLDAAQVLMERMASQRLYGAPIRVRSFLTASTCTNNPIDKIVNLRLYHVEFDREPSLNPDYYVDSAWMTREEYVARRGIAVCGSCLRMWLDYCSHRGSARHLL
jgi:hypothetical protein